HSISLGIFSFFVVQNIESSNSSEQKRAANWVLVWSAGPGPSAGVDSKTKMAAASCKQLILKAMCLQCTRVCAIKVNLVCKPVNFSVLAFGVLAFQGSTTNLKGSLSTCAEALESTGLRTAPIEVVSHAMQGVLLIVFNLILDRAIGDWGYFSHLHSLHIVHIFLVKWEEIGNGVWVNPIRLRVAQKYTKSKTAFARVVLMFFYKKEELKGKRLHELDQDILHTIAELPQVTLRESGCTGNQPKEKEPKNKAAILQSLRTKLNNLIWEDEQRQRRKERRAAMQTDQVVQNLAAE
ncbi:hypothetical protein pdam_00019638, partial [Pocillopora damicornis]